MFAKLKKDLTRKIIFLVWIAFTSLYTLHGVYNYFKISVYKAGASAAIVDIIANIESSQCQSPTTLFAGNREVNLFDVACLQQTENVLESSDQDLN